MDLQTKETLENVSDATVHEPVVITVDVKPIHIFHHYLQQWGILPKKRVFTLHPITMGSLIRISKLLTTIDVSVYDMKNILDSNYRAIEQYGGTLAEIVAIALTNTKQQPGKNMVRFVMNNFTSKEMLHVLGLVLKQMDLTSFMSSIISVKGMNILESRTAAAGVVNLNEMSPLMQGSSIAPGTPSEE